METTELIGLVCNVLSLMILLYQLFEYSVDRCKQNDKELTTNQEIHMILKKIESLEYRRNSNSQIENLTDESRDMERN